MPKIFPSILPDHDKDPDDNSGTLMTPKGYEDESDEEEISDSYEQDTESESDENGGVES